MPRHSSAPGQADPGQSPAPRLGALPWPPKARSCWVSPFFSFPHPGASCGASQTLNNSRDTPRAEAGTTPRYNQAKGAPCLKSPSALPRLPPTPGPPRGEGAAAFCAPTAPAGPGGGALPSPNPTPGDDKRGLLPAAGPEEGAPRGSARSPLPTPPSCSRLPVPGGQRLPSAPPPG